jgi:hypothetical protein
VRVLGADPGLDLGRRAVEHDDRVARVDGHVVAEAAPVLVRVLRVERQLGGAGRSRVAVERDARGVRPAIGHLAEHGAQVLPETRLDVRVLGEESDDSAHG